MIKKILGLFIVLGSIISFSSAVSYIGTGVNDNSVVGQYGFFHTLVGGQNKPFLKDVIGALSLGQGYFWNNNKLYCYKGYSNIEYQGYIGKVGVCYFTGSNFTSCNHPTDFGYSEYDPDVVGEFLKGITYGDFWDTAFQGTNDTPNLSIYDNDTYVSMNFICGNDFDSSYGSVHNLGFQTGNLIQNFTGFESLNSSYMGTPPGYSPGSIDGSSNIGENQNLDGNLMFNVCTNGYVLSKIDKDMPGRRYTCQGGLFDTGIILDSENIINLSPIPGQGVDFKTVYDLTNEGLSWSAWFDKYSSLYNNYIYNRYVYSTNPFYGKNALLWSYFSILSNKGYLSDYGSSDWKYDILNACKLLLYSDWNGEYKGSYFAYDCDDLNVFNGGGSYDTGDKGDIDDDEILPPGFNGTGNDTGVVVGLDWSGTLSGDVNKNFDGKTFISQFYKDLQENYRKPYNGLVGIVPTYILVFMLALILFRFLSH